MAAWAVAALSGPLLPSVAAACACPMQAGEAIWPLADATHVPIDTPLVVARYNLAGSSESIRFQLIDIDGEEVPLIEVNRLAPAYRGCGAVETFFLRPAKPLRADAQYTLAFSETGSPQTGASFTTSDASFEAEPNPTTTLDYLLVRATNCPGPACLELAEAQIGIDQDATRQPRWVVVESKSIEHARNAHVFGTTDPEPTAETQLSIAVPEDHCIHARMYGIEGSVLWEEHRCAPDRCAYTDATTLDSCGGPPLSGLRVTDVPPHSCDAPVTIHQTGPGRHRADQGCRLDPSIDKALPSVVLALTSLLASRVLRRPRRD